MNIKHGLVPGFAALFIAAIVSLSSIACAPEEVLPPPIASQYQGSYTGTFTGTSGSLGTTLVVNENSLTIGSTTVDAKTEGGESADSGSWDYVYAGGDKIGIVLSSSSEKAIALGTVSANAFALTVQITISGVKNGSIRGLGYISE